MPEMGLSGSEGGVVLTTPSLPLSLRGHRIGWYYGLASLKNWVCDPGGMTAITRPSLVVEVPLNGCQRAVEPNSDATCSE